MRHCPEELKTVVAEYKVNISMPEEFIKNMYVGQAHNAFINAIFDRKFDVTAIVDSTGMKMSAEESRFAELLGSSADYKAEYRDGLSALAESMDKDKGIDVIKYEALSKQKMDPAVSEVMKLFMDVYIQHPNSETTDYIINNYITVIERSDVLTDSQKKTAYSAFAVAAYSPRVWTEIYKPN